MRDEENIKISVIIPVYNSAQFLSRCVSSVANQTWRYLEIILVDDGSTDGSGELCDSWAKCDNRISVVHQENRGVSAARNTGLRVASGDYCTFVDSDDWIESTMYMDMVAMVCKYQCDVVLCDCVKDSGVSSNIYSHCIREGYYSEKALREEYYEHLLIQDTIEYPASISNCLLLFKREIYLTHQLEYIEGIRYSEDWLWGSQLMINAKSFYYLKNHAYYHYCTNSESATHTFVKNKWSDYKRLYKETNTYFSKCDYDFSSQLKDMLLFLVYASVGDFERSNLPVSEKKKNICDILANEDVRKMFRGTDIMDLHISFKLKIITAIYKYQMGLTAWIIYCSLRKKK